MEDALKTMVNTFSMSTAKERLPARSAEISEFEVLFRRIIDSYARSVLLFQDEEIRAKEMVKKELEACKAELTEVHKGKGVLRVECNAAMVEAEVMKKEGGTDTDIAANFAQM